MQQRSLGTSGITVSALGVGCMASTLRWLQSAIR